MEQLFEIAGVHKTFHEGGAPRVVLDGLSACIDAGELVAIQGRSGSGKSTLLNLMAGLESPDAGDLRFAGQSILEMSDRQRSMFRRRHLGFVFQFFNLIPTLTVAENVKLVLELNDIGRAAAETRVRGLLQDMGLAERLNTYPDRLSGGEQQRVAIARALAHRPQLVLADEPSGNLDAQSEQQILELLLAVPRRYGASVVVATHSAAVARRADRVLSIDGGRLLPA